MNEIWTPFHPCSFGSSCSSMDASAVCKGSKIHGFQTCIQVVPPVFERHTQRVPPLQGNSQDGSRLEVFLGGMFLVHAIESNRTSVHFLAQQGTVEFTYRGATRRVLSLSLGYIESPREVLLCGGAVAVSRQTRNHTDVSDPGKTGSARRPMDPRLTRSPSWSTLASQVTFSNKTWIREKNGT